MRKITTLMLAGFIVFTNLSVSTSAKVFTLSPEDMKASLSNILKPWRSISFVTKSSNEIISVDYEIKVDLKQAISAIADYKKIIERFDSLADIT